MRRSTRLMACSLPLLLTACVGLHSNQPVQQQYVLSLQAAPSSAPTGTAAAGPGADSATLEVLVPVASAGLGGEEIAVVRAGERLDYYTDGRWAQSATDMLQTLLIQALRRRGQFSLVEPDSGAFGARYMLSIDVTEFEADYQGEGPPTVRVSLICTLGRRSDRAPLTTLTVHSSVMAAADRMRDVIAAFEQATSQALWRVADQLGPTVPVTPASS